MAVYDEAVAPLIGAAVFPDAPVYHWYVSDEPVAVTERTADDPATTLFDCGCVVIAAGLHTVTVAVFESAVPQELVTRTQ